MIFISMRDILTALIPVIFLEAFFLRQFLKISYKEGLSSAGIANAVSTFLGIPCAWILYVLFSAFNGGGGFLELNTCLQKIAAVSLQAAWLPPYERENMQWMVQAARLVLLIPFFLASWASEYFVLKKIHKDLNNAEVNVACMAGNACTYALITMYVFATISKAAP